MEKVSRKRFIRAGTILGVSAAGAPVLAACGDGKTGGSAGSGEGGSGEGGSGGAPIASESEVASGSSFKFEDSGEPAVLVRLDSGDFVAYSAVCTHQRCEVAYREDRLVCPCHGSTFDLTSGGEVVSGPANRPLPEIPVQVRDGEVFKA